MIAERIGQIITQLSRLPKVLFLTDALGAMLSAFLLYSLGRSFNQYVGMPETTLTYLSIIALFFCMYSFTCFLFLNGRWSAFIKIIGIANLMYCILTLGLTVAFYSSLTPLGLVYFAGEILLICGLVYIELTVAFTIDRQRRK